MRRDKLQRTQQEILSDIKFYEKEINDNPNHPTNMYMDRERSKLLKELQAAQMRDRNL